MNFSTRNAAETSGERSIEKKKKKEEARCSNQSNLNRNYIVHVLKNSYSYTNANTFCAHI